MQMSEVCEMFFKHSPIYSRKNHGHTMHRSKDIDSKVKKSHFFSLFEGQNCNLKKTKNMCFFGETFDFTPM